ncbi:MAG: hypothetical protein ACLR8Y_08025 [Alistipes indistinctus]
MFFYLLGCVVVSALTGQLHSPAASWACCCSSGCAVRQGGSAHGVAHEAGRRYPSSTTRCSSSSRWA